MLVNSTEQFFAFSFLAYGAALESCGLSVTAQHLRANLRDDFLDLYGDRSVDSEER